MIQGRVRRREIDDDFAFVEERDKIIGDRYARTATTGCFPGIVTCCVMALPFDRTRERQGGRISNKGNQSTSHTTGCPCDNDVDHLKPYPLPLTLNEIRIL